MIGRLPLTFAVLLTLGAAYFPYAWSVGALLRSEQSGVGSESPSIPDIQTTRLSTDNARVARERLPDQAWAPDAKIQLRDDNRLFYYSNKSEPSENKTAIRFEPFALVWFTQDGPLTIVAESAQVQFQREIEITNPNPGRMMGARLDGDVTIKGPNNLLVVGRNFIYSEKSSKIWSDSPVQLAYDQHLGEAEGGIQLDLKISDVTLKGRQLAVEDLHAVHLSRNVKMELMLPAENNLPPTALQVRCEGSFRLDRRDNGQTSVATFEEKVRVERPTAAGKVDSLEGQTLEVTIVHAAKPTTSEAAPAETAKPSPPNAMQSLRPTLMVCRGSPVVFRSEQNDVHATMGYARYDVGQRTLALSGSESNPSQLRRAAQLKVKPVRCRQGVSEMESQQVVLKHDEHNKVQEVICRGGGWLTYRDDKTKAEQVVVQWDEQLRKYPDSTSALDVIDLSGNATVKQPQQQASFSGNYIKLWIEPLLVGAADDRLSAATSPKPSRGNADAPHERLPMPQPRRMLAQGRVQMQSPQMQGTTSELQVWFEDVAAPSNSGRDSGRDAGRNVGLIRPTAGRRSPSGFFDDDINKPKSAGQQRGQPPTKPMSPVIVDAKLIRVLIVGRGEEQKPDVAEIWTEGNVTITQAREDAATPFKLKADRLHLENQGDTRQKLHLWGKPARIDDPAMELIGDEIYFDRGRNLVSVDGSGKLTLPLDRDFQGQPVTEPTSLNITFNEQMVFDGLIASFVGRVIAATFNSTMKCQQMEVHLTKRLLFEKDAARPERQPVSRLVCRNEVDFDSRVIVNSSMDEVRKGKFAAFAIDLTSGRAEGKGPGKLQIWSRGQNKFAGLTPQAVAGSNKAVRKNEGGWTYYQIDFADELIGLQDLRSATCRGQVQVVYGPVLEALKTFDIDRLPKDAFLVSCDEMQLAQPGTGPTGKKAFELVAEGNAWHEGRSFPGLADVISYDSAKDLFMLRSLGDNDSELTRESRPGGDRIPVIAKSIQFIRASNEIRLHDVRFGSGIQ